MRDEPEFEWDEAKSRKNLRERGFDFEFATRIFDGPCIEEEDLRRNYGERRIAATGKIEDGIFVVVYTQRGERRRIISARPAKSKERDDYSKAYPG
jgi:uncharacterized DUF497 family protein